MIRALTSFLAPEGAGFFSEPIEDRPISLWALLSDCLSSLLNLPLYFAKKKPAKKKKAGNKKAALTKPAVEEDIESEELDVEEDVEEEDEDPDGEDLDDEDLDDEEIEEEIEEQSKEAESGWSGGAGPKDPELIEQFLDGDEQAFTRLVMKYQNKIYNLCCRILGDRDEAQDIAQEIFVTVYKSLEGFRGESLFSTWVFRIAVNHCKNRIKYLGRRRYYQSMSIDQPQEIGDGEIYFEPEDDSLDPEEVMASKQVQDLVQEAISTLDPDHRIVIVLRDIQQLSYEEIAEAVDIKVGTVKSRIHRARNELKDKLEVMIKTNKGAG